MSRSDDNSAFLRRLLPVLLAVCAIWVLHRGTAVLGARPLAEVLAGYADADLLAAGGERALEVVVVQEHALTKALGAAGLWLLAARACIFLATFWLSSAACSLAGGGRTWPADTRPLHLRWALPLVAGASLVSAGLALSFAWGLARLAGWLRQEGVSDWPSHVGAAALAAGVLWLLSELWLDLFRLAVAGAGQRPVAAARSAGRTWFRSFGPLLLARAAALSLPAGLVLAGVLLLPVVTRGGHGERLWAMAAIDLGLLGSLCLRAAWLTWAAAHLRGTELPELKPARSGAAEPSAEPDAPADPSPSPGA